MCSFALTECFVCLSRCICSSVSCNFIIYFLTCARFDFQLICGGSWGVLCSEQCLVILNTCVFYLTLFSWIAINQAPCLTLGSCISCWIHKRIRLMHFRQLKVCAASIGRAESWCCERLTICVSFEFCSSSSLTFI